MSEAPAQHVSLLATLGITAVIILIMARLSVARDGMREEEALEARPAGEGAYVDSWIKDSSDSTVSSVRIAGIGEKSFGKELRVKIIGCKGQGILDTLSWRIDSHVSPDLSFAAPIRPDSIGAVLIAIG